MYVFHVNSPNRFGAKSIGIGLKSHVNVVIKLLDWLIIHIAGTLIEHYEHKISKNIFGFREHILNKIFVTDPFWIGLHDEN